MRLSSNIFRAYDIRGKYPSELNEEAAERIGFAAATFFLKKQKRTNGAIIICRDVRTSSNSLAKAITKGIWAAGADVLDAGIGTTPYFYFLMHAAKSSGGIMVTASHNPPEYNGFKLCDSTGRAVGMGFGLEKVRQIAFRISKKRLPQRIGAAAPLGDFRGQYVQFLTNDASVEKMRIAVDAAGGATTHILPALFNQLPGVLYKPLFFEPDGSFARHPPNPLLPDAQKYIIKELQSGIYRFGVIFDGDGDRALFFDERGVFVPSEYILGLFAMEELGKKKKIKIVFPVNTSRGVREWLQEHGGAIFLSRIGHSFINLELTKKKARFAAEPSGHFHFQDFYYHDSAMLALVRLMDFLSKNRAPLSHLVKPFQRYISSGEVNFQISDPDAAFARILEKYKKEAGVKISTLDGITIEFSDWWCNIRPSNTEPMVRMVAEARTEELLEEKRRELEELLLRE